MPLIRAHCAVYGLGWGYDDSSRAVYIDTWWKYNKPENKNILLGNLKDIHNVPGNVFLPLFYNNLTCLPETLHQTFSERLPKPSPIQEQEQEQEQEQDIVAPTPDVDAYKKTKKEKLIEDADEVIRYLNEKCGKTFKFFASSREPILGRFGEGYLVEDCRRVVDAKLSSSSGE